MLHTSSVRWPLALAAATALLFGCRGGNGSQSTIPMTSLQRTPVRGGALRSIDKIKHVIIVIQENRSFNNLFYGFPGAKTVTYGYDSKNQKVALKPISLATSWDLAHNFQGFLAACNGTGKTPGTHCQMNGFDKEQVYCGVGSEPKCPIKYPPYEYVPHDETAPYFSMAKQYVLGDQMYPSNMDSSSYVSHQYIIAAQAGATLNYPNANWGCPGGVHDIIWTITAQPPRKYDKQVEDCFNYQTIGDELDKAGGSWAFYAAALGKPAGGGKTCGSGLRDDGKYVLDGVWSAYQAVKHICYGPDWDQDVFDPPQQFLTDVGNGQLRDVTWVTPYCQNSDHPGCNSDTGPSWVASVVNAVGESKFWDSTAIFIFWDDYGGLYDPDPPAYKDYDGLGIRVPLLIISPYAKKGWISHVHYEHGSILRFVEDRFRLAPLSASDKRATNPVFDCFDFSQAPRKFVPIQAKYDTNFFLHQAPDFRPPDTD